MRPPPAFDAYAAAYDADFTDSATGRAQRRQVWRCLDVYLAGDADILEINCGTGEDARYLAGRGFRVVATDASEAMLREAGKKLAADHLHGQVERIQSDFLSLTDHLEGRQFDLLFSNFGGLNCLSPEETRRAARQFARLLRPGGRLFLVYMTSNCLWEKAYYYWKRDFRRAGRRRSAGPVTAYLKEQAVHVWYYSPARLRTLYAPAFSLLAANPVGLFLPPSYLEHYFRSRPTLLGLLERMDQWTDRLPLANLADHMALVFQKTTPGKTRQNPKTGAL